MKREAGRKAVWEHAGEADLQDFITRVAARFDIDDVAIFTPGKLTYLRELPKPPKHRVGIKVHPVTGRLLVERRR